jgi:hypothetical protein
MFCLGNPLTTGAFDRVVVNRNLLALDPSNPRFSNLALFVNLATIPLSYHGSVVQSCTQWFSFCHR